MHVESNGPMNQSEHVCVMCDHIGTTSESRRREGTKEHGASSITHLTPCRCASALSLPDAQLLLLLLLPLLVASTRTVQMVEAAYSRRVWVIAYTDVWNFPSSDRAMRDESAREAA
jgi:hypothetical protein